MLLLLLLLGLAPIVASIETTELLKIAKYQDPNNPVPIPGCRVITDKALTMLMVIVSIISFWFI